MKKLFVFLICLAGCEVKPEPLFFGKDLCHTCKMTLIDNKYGAELVTKKGKIYKFDDMNCMLNFYHSGYEEPTDFQFLQVIDFSRPGILIDGMHALYLKSDDLRTPMASGIAAFESEQTLNEAKQTFKGVMLSWGEVNTQFK